MTTYPDELADLDPMDLFDSEVHRLDEHFVGVAAAGRWEAPTACAGWSTRDLLAHLRNNHRYDLACLDDDIPGLFAKAADNGVTDPDSFNAWGVRLGRERDVDELLAEWRVVSADVRRRFRDLGRGGVLATMAGPYNTGLQALHLAYEHAVHADDMNAEVAEGESAARLAWRARVARFILTREKHDGATLELRDGANRVTHGADEAILDDAELVLALTGRLGRERVPSDDLRAALSAFG